MTAPQIKDISISLVETEPESQPTMQRTPRTILLLSYALNKARLPYVHNQRLYTGIQFASPRYLPPLPDVLDHPQRVTIRA
jgi:hypothetical protein